MYSWCARCSFVRTDAETLVDVVAAEETVPARLHNLEILHAPAQLDIERI